MTEQELERMEIDFLDYERKEYVDCTLHKKCEWKNGRCKNFEICEYTKKINMINYEY